MARENEASSHKIGEGPHCVQTRVKSADLFCNGVPQIPGDKAEAAFAERCDDATADSYSYQKHRTQHRQHKSAVSCDKGR